MTQSHNVLAAIFALLCATLAGVNWSAKPTRAGADQAISTGHADFVQRTLPNGKLAIVDASGTAIELKRFERIASASTVADSLLLEFVEPDRVVAFTAYGMAQGWQKHRFAKASSISQLDDVEALLSLHPDLVLASLNGSEQIVERLRESGIVVFNLGPMRGVESFLRSARGVAALCGRPESGEQYASTFLRRIERIALDVPIEKRKSALYVSLLGDKLYGSGRDTNYADILKYSGFRDLGAEHYQGFPEYSAEELLSLNPEYLVTRSDNRSSLCERAGLSQLQACADRKNHVLELPEAVISSAGEEMLLAAEWLHDLAYSEKPPR